MKPILFNTDMVRAILDGRKTMTRRVVKPRYRAGEAGFYVVTNKHTGEYVRIEIFDEWENETRWLNEPYRPGDILYVRETWCENGDYELYPFEIDKFLYKASSDIEKVPILPEWFRGWRPSIHMPREAARIFLRVTDVRVERLQDITDKGILAEGIRQVSYPEKGTMKWRRYQLIDYVNLWNSTIKPVDRALYGWDANPWVWVIEFERISREEADHERE